MLNRWQTWAFSFCGWTAYAIFCAAGSFGFLVAAGAKPTVSQVVVYNLSSAYLWAILTPPICVLARTYEINRATWKKSLGVHLLAGLLAIAVVACILVNLQKFLGLLDPDVPIRAHLMNAALQNLPICLAVMGVAQAIAYYARFREREWQSAQLEIKLAQAQLEILRGQLEPHFLFNTLNSIATLATKNPPSAERMTLKLAALLRASLDCRTAQEITLQQELNVLQNYLDIQQTRFHDRLRVLVNVDPGLLNSRLPSLILQPLVENAIRHGIAKSAAPGLIEIRADRDNCSMRIEITDNGAGLERDFNRDPEGIGLRNIKHRLEQLYGDQHEFRLENVPGGGCKAIVAVPLTVAA